MRMFLTTSVEKLRQSNNIKKALAINPNWGMAIGNLGVAYQYYGRLVSDPSHERILHNSAIRLLVNATNSDDHNIYSEAMEYFKRCIDIYDPAYIRNVTSTFPTLSEHKYTSKSELIYKNWVLHNNLFLHPLNDLPYFDYCFATDFIHLPNMIMKKCTKPIFHGIFNQLKQEYIFARYQYYCSIQIPSKPHFADKDIYLVDFADHTQYSVRIEQMKCSFRILYSLLDKVAFFINSYFELGIEERKVFYHNIWKNIDPSKYKNTENYAFSSLYWISKDFKVRFVDSPNPQAERISNIRNALEHRYVKICRLDLNVDETMDKVDDRAFFISEIELTDKTMWLLKLIREVIICLALTVGVEEREKRKALSNDVIVDFPLSNYDDERKI